MWSRRSNKFETYKYRSPIFCIFHKFSCLSLKAKNAPSLRNSIPQVPQESPKTIYIKTGLMHYKKTGPYNGLFVQSLAEYVTTRKFLKLIFITSVCLEPF